MVIDTELPNQGDDLIQTDDLSKTESNIDIIDRNINDLITEQRFFDARQEKFREEVNNSRWNSVIISIFASFIVIFLTAWQLCFIKRIVNTGKTNRFGI